MKAVVWHDVGDIRMEEVKEPVIQEPTDAIVRITMSAICGTDLHMIRGTMAGMREGTILGHEGVGVIEELGQDVRNLRIGDRVVMPSTIACGYCFFCRSGNFSQCDNSNPNGSLAGTAFFGGPQSTGAFDGFQAEKARIPFANAMLVKLPERVTDEQAILISDIFPTGYMGAEMAEIKGGETVAVFGCGPVGLFAIISAQLMDAGRIIAVDRIPSRLQKARELGVETINFDEENPVDTLHRLTGGIGPDRIIDAVGVDAEHAVRGPVSPQNEDQLKSFHHELEQVVPKQNPHDDLWVPGSAPSQVLSWAISAVAKAGTVSIIGVYPPTMNHFPIGQAMGKNLTLRMGNCNHRKYIPKLVRMVATGEVDPTVILTHDKPLASAIEAYEQFDRRERGWVKVELEPTA
jgi:threonine dehydrogenase-like Zn-dependent dehydrogenase